MYAGHLRRLLSLVPPSIRLPRLLRQTLLLWLLTFGFVRLAAEEARPAESVGTLDFFGLRRVTEAKARAALKIKEGDPYDRQSSKALTAAVEAIPGVSKATVSAITVDGTGKLKIFVGVLEEGSSGFTLREVPQGEQRLPAALAQIYDDFIKALGPAVRKGTGGEEHAQGHALSKDPDMRKAQDAAVEQLKAHTAVVQEILRSSRHAEDRGAAAWLLGYAPAKKVIAADLVAAARDPNGSVRNNATRALGIIVEYATAHPELGIVIESEVFLDMLRSVTWTDRNKVTFLLDGMTKSGPRAAELRRTLREQRMPELIEIARWKSDGHAFPAIRILGRIAGWDEKTIILSARREEGLEKLIAAASAVK